MAFLLIPILLAAAGCAIGIVGGLGLFKTTNSVTTITTATDTTTTTTTVTTSTMTTTTISTTTSTSTSRTTTTTTTSTTSTTTAPVCTPFWSVPSSVQTTYATYSGSNTLISGGGSRSGCVWVRASTANNDNIIFSIGSALKTWKGGCNQHFALAVTSTSQVTVYGMCGSFDNNNIYVGASSLYDGSFHQLCVTYNTNTAQLCVYLDLLSPQCLIRSNPRYNTGSGDVRIGWWTDLNRSFFSSGVGMIKLISLFNSVINQTCVTYQYQLSSVA